MDNPIQFNWRCELKSEDRLTIKEVLESVRVFHSYEVDIALELVDENLAKGEVKSGYYFLLLELDNQLVGYSCFGPIGCTDQRYDLYWIVVNHKFRGQQLGKKLLAASEERIKELGGQKIYIETSSRDVYESTRQFYLKAGYMLEAILQDFYANGDHKMIYSKIIP